MSIFDSENRLWGPKMLIEAAHMSIFDRPRRNARFFSSGAAKMLIIPLLNIFDLAEHFPFQFDHTRFGDQRHWQPAVILRRRWRF